MYVVVRRFDVEIDSRDEGYESANEFLDDLGISVQTLDSLRLWHDREIDMWSVHRTNTNSAIAFDETTVRDRTVEKFEGLYFSHQLIVEPKTFAVEKVELTRLLGSTIVMSTDVEGVWEMI